MKTIIVIIAAAVMTVSAQAANWKWAMSNVYDGTGSTETTAKYSGTAYLFDAASYTQSALFDLIAKGDDVTGFAVTSTAVVEGLVNANLTTSQFSYGDDGVAKSYTFYAVIIESDKAYFSSEKKLNSNTTTTAATIGLGTQNNGSATFSSVAPTGTTFAGSGHWSAVPEPTSGLLVMLGVGLMALRRRRA